MTLQLLYDFSVLFHQQLYICYQPLDLLLEDNHPLGFGARSIGDRSFLTVDSGTLVVLSHHQPGFNYVNLRFLREKVLQTAPTDSVSVNKYLYTRQMVPWLV